MQKSDAVEQFTDMCHGEKKTILQLQMVERIMRTVAYMEGCRYLY
jgi:hypothetical protein